MTKRRGRPSKISPAEALGLLSYVMNICRDRGVTLRRACEWIAADPAHVWPDLERDSSGKVIAGESRLDGWIDGSGWIRGNWIDDPDIPVVVLNYLSSPRAFERLYYRLQKRSS